MPAERFLVFVGICMKSGDSEPGYDARSRGGFTSPLIHKIHKPSATADREINQFGFRRRAGAISGGMTFIPWNFVGLFGIRPRRIAICYTGGAKSQIDPVIPA